MGDLDSWSSPTPPPPCCGSLYPEYSDVSDIPCRKIRELYDAQAHPHLCRRTRGTYTYIRTKIYKITVRLVLNFHGNLFCNWASEEKIKCVLKFCIYKKLQFDWNSTNSRAVPATIFLFLFPLSLSLSPLVQLSSLSPRLRMENGQVFRILTLLARGFRFLVTLLFWSSPLSKFSLFLRRRGVGCCFVPFAVRPFLRYLSVPVCPSVLTAPLHSSRSRPLARTPNTQNWGKETKKNAVPRGEHAKKFLWHCAFTSVHRLPHLLCIRGSLSVTNNFVNDEWDWGAIRKFHNSQ